MSHHALHAEYWLSRGLKKTRSRKIFTTLGCLSERDHDNQGDSNYIGHLARLDFVIMVRTFLLEDPPRSPLTLPNRDSFLQLISMNLKADA